MAKPPTSLLLSLYLASIILERAQAVAFPPMASRTIPQITADRHGAKCLGGERPSMEIRRNASSNKWVLFLEGGGWCNGATADGGVTLRRREV